MSRPRFSPPTRSGVGHRADALMHAGLRGRGSCPLPSGGLAGYVMSSRPAGDGQDLTGAGTRLTAAEQRDAHAIDVRRAS